MYVGMNILGKLVTSECCCKRRTWYGIDSWLSHFEWQNIEYADDNCTCRGSVSIKNNSAKCYFALGMFLINAQPRHAQVSAVAACRSASFGSVP